MTSSRGLTYVFYMCCVGSWILYHSRHLGSSKHTHLYLYGHLSLGRLGLSSSLYPSCSTCYLLCTKGMLIGIIMYKELEERRAGSVKRKRLLELSNKLFAFFTLNVNIKLLLFFTLILLQPRTCIWYLCCGVVSRSPSMSRVVWYK